MMCLSSIIICVFVIMDLFIGCYASMKNESFTPSEVGGGPDADSPPFQVFEFDIVTTTGLPITNFLTDSDKLTSSKSEVEIEKNNRLSDERHLIETFNQSREEEFKKQSTDPTESSTVDENENKAFFAKNIRNLLDQEAVNDIKKRVDDVELSNGQKKEQTTEKNELTKDEQLANKSELSKNKENMENINLNNAVNIPMCPSINEIPTFVRHSTLMHKQISPSFVSRVNSLVECTETCRLNTGLMDNPLLDCRFFTYTSRDNENLCELYNNKSMLELTEQNSSESSPNILTKPSQFLNAFDYFERICLTIPDECGKSAFSFEKYPKKYLNIEPIEFLEVENQKRCLDFCLTNLACRGINYNEINGTCQILDRGWRLVTNGIEDSSVFDYYENTCYQENNRCTPQRRIDFLLTKNVELEAFNVFGGFHNSIQNCMRKCIESGELFCRAFHYNEKTSECILAVEGFYQINSFTSPSILSTSAITSDYLNLYEPVCLDENVELPCPNMHIFERFPEINFIDNTGGERLIKGQDIPNATLETCMDICLYENSCLSFIYSRSEQWCKLLPFTRNTTDSFSMILEPLIDYYELACERNLTGKTLDPNEFNESTTLPMTQSQIEKSGTLDQKKEANNNFGNVPENFDTSVGTVIDLTTPSSKLNQENSDTGIINKFSNNHLQDEKAGEIHNSKGSLIESGRTLRLEYRNFHHINILDVMQCEILCRESTINCSTFAYNAQSRDCLLSSTEIHRNNSRFVLFTQPNPNYNLYSYKKNESESDSKKNNLEQNKSSFEDTNSFTNEKQQEQTTDIPLLIKNPSLRNNLKELSATIFMENPGITLETSSLPTDTTISAHRLQDDSLSNSINLNSMENSKSDESTNSTPLTEETTTTAVTTKPIIQTTNSLPINTELIIKEIPRKISTLRKINSDDLKVEAICLSHGINVTFRLLNYEKYTGAVYAAERFSQCRTFVEDGLEFSIHIHRPTINSECNALEVDGKMTAIIVLSNDMVLPFDVTTKDDYFYHVSCDYNSENDNFEFENANDLKIDISSNEKQNSAIVHSGVVVGGPEPKFIMSSKRRPQISENTIRQMRVNLRILRNGRSVHNVYIGEKLTAFVTSNDIDANRLSVADCNATRVGGRQPRPNSVQLIDHGCSLMPQIIGNMRRVKGGFEAPLTAFRIDGSDQIDIVCSVEVCRIKCYEPKEKKCPKSRTKRTNSVQRIQTSNNDWIEEKSIDDAESDMITVDQRLRVIVMEDDANNAEINNGLDWHEEIVDFETTDVNKAVRHFNNNNHRNGEIGGYQHSQHLDIEHHNGRNRNNHLDDENEEEIMSSSAHQPQQNSPHNLLKMLMHMDSSSAAEYCMNPLMLLGLLALLVLCAVGLVISLVAHCYKRQNQSTHSPPFIYSTGTELSAGTVGATSGNNNFHVPRVDRYMA